MSVRDAVSTRQKHGCSIRSKADSNFLLPYSPSHRPTSDPSKAARNAARGGLTRPCRDFATRQQSQVSKLELAGTKKTSQTPARRFGFIFTVWWPPKKLCLPTTRGRLGIYQTHATGRGADVKFATRGLSYGLDLIGLPACFSVSGRSYTLFCFRTWRYASITRVHSHHRGGKGSSPFGSFGGRDP